jgi:hypothetical protein
MTADILPIHGKTLTRISGIEEDDVRFHCSDGEIFRMYHHQDCCESVGIEQIDGDISDLIGAPLTTAEVVFQKLEDDDDGLTGWTFYKFATIRGYVTIRWSGSSNGYYSISVSFENEKDCYDC